MKFSTRRLSATIVAAVMMASVVAEPVFAQMNPTGASVGPAGGVGSTTAPANGQGTPAGGTGVIGTTRVGPSGVSPMAAPSTTPSDVGVATPVSSRSRRHRHRHARRHRRVAAEVGTQSQDGTNGAAMPSR